MIKNFENVCVRMSEAKAMELEAEKVLNVLIENGGAMRAKEIALACGWGFPNGFVNHQRATHPLKWLVELGLVERVEIDGEPIEVENYHIFNSDGVLICDCADSWAYRRLMNALGIKGLVVTPFTKTITPKIAMFQIVA